MREPPPWLGIIADDVTGATDAAAYVSRSGHPTVQFFGVPVSDVADRLQGAACVVLALKIRSSPADVAVAEALDAARWLESIGIEHLYFKYCSTFDSTSDGNIGPVADALADHRGVEQLLVVPSAPENGRTVYKSRLFVYDQLLSDSPMKDHALTPMREADLRKLMSAQSKHAVRAVHMQTVLGGPVSIEHFLADLADLADGRQNIVGDAVTTGDLESWAPVALQRGLSTGSAGLVGAIAAARKRPFADGRQLPAVPDGPVVILAGSCSAATQRQVSHFLDRHPGHALGVPSLAGGPGGLEAARVFIEASVAAGEAPLVYSTCGPGQLAEVQASFGAAEAASLVEDAMGELAVWAVELGARRVIVAGGETSGAVVHALGGPGIRFADEVAPGVPWAVTLQDDALGLLLKSGNFGAEDFFETAVAWR